MKRIFSILLVFAMALSLMACGGQSEPTVPSSTAAHTEVSTTAAPTEAPTEMSAEAAAHYPLTVTDQAGREVTIESEPQRIVSGYYISTSALIALGQADRLVGIEAKADKRPIYRHSAPELIDLPNVGSAKEFDLEGCAALEPDLVILPMKLKNAADTLSDLGIPVILVNPENQPLLQEMIGLIADATNSRSQALALQSFTETQEIYLNVTLEDAEKPTVYLAGNSGLLSTAGEAMYQSDLICLAGGKNAAAEITDTYWAEVSYEQLLAWNPQYIILASDAGYTVEDVLADENLAACDAVTSGHVYQLPGDAEAWDSPVPSGILGAMWLANVLHPELVSQEECTAVMNEYYETFYGFTYSQG